MSAAARLLQIATAQPVPRQARGRWPARPCPPSARPCRQTAEDGGGACPCPRWSSIMAPHQIWPMGLAMPLPAMSGALPCIGSNIEGNWRSGLMLAPGAMAISARASCSSRRSRRRRSDAQPQSAQAMTRMEAAQICDVLGGCRAGSARQVIWMTTMMAAACRHLRKA